MSAAGLNVVVTFTNTVRRDCFDVTIIDDKLVEQNENFQLELQFLTGFNQSGVILEPSRASITIVDDGNYLVIYSLSKSTQKSLWALFIINFVTQML